MAGQALRPAPLGYHRTGENMIRSHGYAAAKAKAALAPFAFERRVPGDRDVFIEILYCGVCHTDIHQVDNDWGMAEYIIVPGHEIVGREVQVGFAVTKFAAGDLAGVGCLLDSCLFCSPCHRGEEQFCEDGPTFTYSSAEKVTGGFTYGGYSNKMVVDEAFALKISPKLDLAAAAPLLCAGITTYSPLRRGKRGAAQQKQDEPGGGAGA